MIYNTYLLGKVTSPQSYMSKSLNDSNPVNILSGRHLDNILSGRHLDRLLRDIPSASRFFSEDML